MANYCDIAQPYDSRYNKHGTCGKSHGIPRHHGTMLPSPGPSISLPLSSSFHGFATVETKFYVSILTVATIEECHLYSLYFFHTWSVLQTEFFTCAHEISTHQPSYHFGGPVVLFVVAPVFLVIFQLAAYFPFLWENSFCCSSCRLFWMFFLATP